MTSPLKTAVAVEHPPSSRGAVAIEIIAKERFIADENLKVFALTTFAPYLIATALLLKSSRVRRSSQFGFLPLKGGTTEFWISHG
jgi:hypothetical protein